MTEDRLRAQGAFFGRRKGRPLRDQQAAGLEEGLSTYGLELTAAAPADLCQLFASQVEEVRLEIGFGGGEHLLFRARQNPQVGFIGVEPFVNGMAKVTAALAADPLGNVRLFSEDATRLLDWLPSGGLAAIDLLYPDPWPKKRHWKRRFVGAQNLQRFARVLRPGGAFRFASDIDTYVNWTLQHCEAHPDFEWTARTADDWHKPYEGWPGTRYEAKALREGRAPAYLTFRRA